MWSLLRGHQLSIINSPDFIKGQICWYFKILISKPYPYSFNLMCPLIKEKAMFFSSKPATNVKIGESRLCHLDYCPDHEEERNLQILSIVRQSSSSEHPTDLALLEVATIMFSRKVRPACLFHQLHTIQTQGWFARYSETAEECKYNCST